MSGFPSVSPTPISWNRPTDQRRLSKPGSAARNLSLAAIAITSLTVGCSSNGAVTPVDFGVTPPSVVLISIDSLRSDHLGTYGYGRETSPNIDALADEGVVFERTMSTSTFTLPAHMSMLSSLNARVHGVINDGKRLTPSATLISEVFQRNGWHTAAVVGAPYLNHEFGFAQGFDVYDDETISFASKSASHLGRTSLKTHQRALELLDDFGTDPFFLFLHYWDVHFDYIPPYPFQLMFDPDYEGDMDARDFLESPAINPDMDPRDLEHIVALYDGEIALVDMFIGRLFGYLKRRGLWDNTMVIVTADHGDEFFEHGGKAHRRTLYRETLQIPLVIKFPASRWGGHRVASIAGVVDIAPTILEVAGLEALPESNGRSLLPQVTGGAEPTVYFADLHGDLGAVISDPLKLIRGSSQGSETLALFDIHADSDEMKNLAEKRTDDFDALAALLDRWIATSETRAAKLGTGEFEYSVELTEALRSLVYIQ